MSELKMELKDKIGYGLGDLGISLAYFSVGFFFIYYLTDGVGMEPYLAGIAFFIGQLWDSINDPLMGVLSDKTQSKFGRKRVYILFGAIPFGISFVLLWYIPVVNSEVLQFIFATLIFLFHTTAYTVVAVPYVALVPIMTQDYDERTQIVGIRAMLSTFGTIAGAGAALIVSGDDEIHLGNLHTMAIIFGAISSITLIIAAQSVKQYEVHSEREENIGGTSLGDYLQIFKNRTVLLLLSVKFVGAIATGSLTASLPYYAETVLGDTSLSTYGLAVYIVVSALLIPVYNQLTLRTSKQKILLVTNTLTAIVLIYLGFFVTGGMLGIFLIGTALLGLFMSAYLLIPYSMVPDLVDYYEYATEERHESVFFGLWSTIHSLGIAFSGLILSIILQISNYDGSIEVQPESAKTGIRIAFGLVPGLFLILTALILNRYHITRDVFENMRTVIEERQTNSNIDNNSG